MDYMNDSRSWTQGSKWYEQLRIIVDMNDSGLWSQGFRCYEQLKVVDDICYSGSWDQGCGCFEWLNIVGDINDLGSHKLRSLDDMSNLWMEMIWMILHHELKPMHDMND